MPSCAFPVIVLRTSIAVKICVIARSRARLEKKQLPSEALVSMYQSETGPMESPHSHAGHALLEDADIRRRARMVLLHALHCCEPFTFSLDLIIFPSVLQSSESKHA